MASVKEIEAARKQAVRNADLQIVEAIARKNASASDKTRAELDTIINALMAARTELSIKAVLAMDESEEMKRALKAIEETTTEVHRVAEREKNLAEFKKLAAAFSGAGGQLAAAIK